DLLFQRISALADLYSGGVLCDQTSQRLARPYTCGMPSTPTRRDRQMVRILGLLAALLEGGRPSVRELASRFNTRRETIYRDLRALSDAGYPIVGDENGRLSHPRLLDRTVHAVTARIQMTEEEIAALLWAGRHQGPRGPLGKALPAACTKLRTMAA